MKNATDCVSSCSYVCRPVFTASVSLHVGVMTEAKIMNCANMNKRNPSTQYIWKSNPYLNVLIVIAKCSGLCRTVNISIHEWQETVSIHLGGGCVKSKKCALKSYRL